MSEVEDAMENEFDGIDKYDLVEEILESRIKLTGLEATIAAQAKEIERLKTRIELAWAYYETDKYADMAKEFEQALKGE